MNKMLSCLNAGIGLDTHIHDVLGVLKYEDLRNVVLVGHSYGGMVIAGVAEKAPERIAYLVYLDAFVPGDGQSLVDFQPPKVLARFKEKTLTEGDGYKLPSFPAEAFGLTDEEDLAWVRPRLNPHPVQNQTGRGASLQSEGGGDSQNVYRSNRAGGPFGQFAERLKGDEAWQYREIATGHDAMITEPQKLSVLLLELAVIPPKYP